MEERSNAKRLVIFNHKGGVGKTTLTVNIAIALAKEGKKVLLVDADSQCNLTSYLIADEVVDDLLDNSDLDSGRTIWSALKPIAEAEGDINIIEPFQLEGGNLFLVPGDIRLSEFENELNDFWGQCSLLRPKGFRGTTAISRLVNEISKKIDADYVFFDTGPNIGPLNRAILLDCDYFIVPAACDLFSLRALKTLGNTLVSWINDWTQLTKLAPTEIYLLPGKPAFLGFIPQRFRIYRGVVAKQHSGFLQRIQKEVQSQIVVLLRKIDPNLAKGRISEFKLGEIKDYGSLVSDSQQHGVSIGAATIGTPEQRGHASTSFAAIATSITKRISEVEV
ncbi:MAG: ParA family protein [Gammaproteobacteria bacterium]